MKCAETAKIIADGKTTITKDVGILHVLKIGLVLNTLTG